MTTLAEPVTLAPNTFTTDRYQVVLSFQFLRLYATPQQITLVMVPYIEHRCAIPTLATLADLCHRARN